MAMGIALKVGDRALKVGDWSRAIIEFEDVQVIFGEGFSYPQMLKGMAYLPTFTTKTTQM